MIPIVFALRRTYSPVHRNNMHILRALLGCVVVWYRTHYSDVIMGTMASLITSLTSAPNRPSRRRSKKTSKLRVTSLCAGNSPDTGEFPAQMASNTENVSIWWRHHEFTISLSIISLASVQPHYCPCANTEEYWNASCLCRLRTHRHNKTKHTTTTCIYYGIYCTFRDYTHYEFRWFNLSLLAWQSWEWHVCSTI